MGVALAACSGISPPSPPTLRVELVQQRGDIAAGRIQLRVTNASPSRATITAAILASPVLAGPADWSAARPVVLEAGRTTDLPVLLPDPRCTAGSGAAYAHLTVDGEATTAAVTDALDVLGRAGAIACDEDDLFSVVQVTVSRAVAATNGAITLSLDVDPAPHGEGSVELVALRGTVLLRFDTGAEAPLGVTVAAGDPSTTIDVTLVPRRCDAHAIAEDKVGTLFDLVARVDGREIVVPLERPDALGDALLTLTAQACGLIPSD